MPSILTVFFDVIERAVQAFVLEAEATGILNQAVVIASGPGDEATRAKIVAGVSENNFWSIVARAALNYGKYTALVVGSTGLAAGTMVAEGALNKVGQDLADHYRLSHAAINLLQTIPDPVLQADQKPDDVKPILEEAKEVARGVTLPPIPIRKPLAPAESPVPPVKY